MGCKGREQSRGSTTCNLKVKNVARPHPPYGFAPEMSDRRPYTASGDQALTFFSVNGIITPRRKSVT